MSNYLYKAQSLEDIAVQFDRNAGQAMVWAASAKTKREIAMRETEAATWRATARILRQTKLEN